MKSRAAKMKNMNEEYVRLGHYKHYQNLGFNHILYIEFYKPHPLFDKEIQNFLLFSFLNIKKKNLAN